MYVFSCSNGHTSYSASKEQHDMTCPECGEEAVLVNDESQDRVTKALPNE